MNLASHELYYLSQFIAPEMFNISIPSNILEWYNYKEKYGLSDEEKKKSRKEKSKSKPKNKSHSADSKKERQPKAEDDLLKNLTNDIPLKNIPSTIKKVLDKHSNSNCKCSNDFSKVINTLKQKNN